MNVISRINSACENGKPITLGKDVVQGLGAVISRLGLWDAMRTEAALVDAGIPPARRPTGDGRGPGLAAIDDEARAIDAALADVQARMDKVRGRYDPRDKPQFTDDVPRAARAAKSMAELWAEYSALAARAAESHRRRAAHWAVRAGWGDEDNPRAAE